MEAVDDLCRILASGKNVVSSSVVGLVHPRASASVRRVRPGESVQKAVTRRCTGEKTVHRATAHARAANGVVARQAFAPLRLVCPATASAFARVGRVMHDRTVRRDRPRSTG